MLGGGMQMKNDHRLFGVGGMDRIGLRQRMRIGQKAKLQIVQQSMTAMLLQSTQNGQTTTPRMPVYRGLIMTNDREMLELAAKAMQATGDPNFCNYTVLDNSVCLELGSRRGAITGYWKPHEYGDDAMRLAVKLGIGTIHHQGWGQVFHPSLNDRMDFEYEDDPYAATRRAVVRAAAEIGKGMKP